MSRPFGSNRLPIGQFSVSVNLSTAVLPYVPVICHLRKQLRSESCAPRFDSLRSMTKHKLFLLRHGEGAWNKENRFCSWVDQRLSEAGVTEAQECGRLLKERGYEFDIIFTSILSRSVQTAWLVMEAMGQEWVPVVKSWRLNERHYGALIGLNRAEMALNHGEERVKVWRRSYDVTPPPIDESHPYFNEIYSDRRYVTCDIPKEELPRAESLKEVLERLLPYWNDVISPQIKQGKTVLISAHGNSCRALLKHLEGVSDADIADVTLPTGVPVLLELDDNLRPLKARQLLGDPAKIQAAIKKVEDQGKATVNTK
ncbi:bisphosphoglycerate mutase-like isoform X1 [Scleropages formosus]|uniref:Phosphoglycerate mutase n=2 Tax=Scleropages formosus TaxID=113540 RepID=A0A8C9QY65_SCLFO|nr:bisphosphoglycerate mutase-like isoform X1 [Scleropages formosus]